MGVMSCSRKGCDHILCETYIDDIGYICNSCKEEFKEYLNANSIYPKNSFEAKEVLNKFMDTRSGEFECDPNFDIDEFLK